MIRPTDKGHVRRDARIVPDEIRDRQAPLRIELHEDAAPVNEERHPVGLRRKSVLAGDLALETIEQIRAADADGRKHEILEAIKFPDVPLRQDGTEYRGNGNPPLGIYPVRRIGQEPGHDAIQPLPPPGRCASAPT